MFPCTSASLGRHEHGGRCPHSERFIPFQRIFVCGFGVFSYHGRDFCALTFLQRERMGLGQLLHQASGDGLVGGGSDAAVMAQCGSQLPASCSLSSCFPNILLGGSRSRASAQSQSSVLQHFEHSGMEANPTPVFTASLQDPERLWTPTSLDR